MIKTLGDRVAIIPIEDPDQTPGGIWLPDQAKQKVDQGIVKYRGKDVKDLKVGMHVLFSGYTGTKVSLADEGILYIMAERDVECYLDGEPAQIFDLATIERIMKTRLGELSLPTQNREPFIEAIEIFSEEIIDRLSSLTTSEGFEF